MPSTKQTEFSRRRVLNLSDRLLAAANGDYSWRGNLLREAAQAMSTGTAKTPKAVEGRSPASAVGEAEAPLTPCSPEQNQ